MSLLRAIQAEEDRRKRVREQKEEAEEDLLAFVRMFWRLLEPEQPLIEGWPLEAMCDFLMAATDGHIKRGLLNVPPGFSKALDEDTPILTTWGWKRHGDLVAGDFVFGPEGTPKRVLHRFETRYEPAYEVSFDDGAALVASADHLWSIERDKAYSAPKWKRTRKATVVKTKELIGSVKFRDYNEMRPDRIAIAAPVQLPPQHLLIDPYVLGCWLGDGGTMNATIYVGHRDIGHFGALGAVRKTKDVSERGQAFYAVTVDGLSTCLRVLGLFGHKHIPENYQQASIEQRWQLLRGLMDTDGSASKEGHCFYVTKLPELGEQIHRLVCSLGIKAQKVQTWSMLNGKKFGPYTQIRFTPPQGSLVFALARKQARIKGHQNARSRYRYVKEVREVEPRKLNCIAVEGNIYLAGHRLVPTHNSTLLNVMWPAWEWGPQNMAHLRYISASYSTAIPERDNLRFGRIIKSQDYQACWGDRVTLLRDGIELVENTKTGWKRTASISGGTTGHRGNRVLIDDANDPVNVESDTVREATNRWLREVMPDRLNSLADDVVINLQQRTHNEDATGTLAKYGTGYTDHWLMIPMEFDPLRFFPVTLRKDDDGNPVDQWRDPRGLDEDGNELAGLFTNEKGNVEVRPGSPMAQAEGLLAWPERFPPEQVAEQQKIKDTAYDAQYQQSPNPKKGNIIRRDWWQTWTQRHFPAVGTVVASLDTAIEENDANDYNALTIWGAFAAVTGEPQLILMDAWQDRLSLADLVETVAEKCFKHKVDYLLIEHKTRGRDVHDEIIRGYQNATWSTQLVKVDKSKRARLNAVSRFFSGEKKRIPDLTRPGKFIDMWSGGMIWAPNTEWADEVIEQCAEFPKAAHDDFADSTSQALLWVRRNGVVVRKVEFEAQQTDAKTFKKRAGVPYAMRSK